VPSGAPFEGLLEEPALRCVRDPKNGEKSPKSVKQWYTQGGIQEVYTQGGMVHREGYLPTYTGEAYTPGWVSSLHTQGGIYLSHGPQGGIYLSHGPQGRLFPHN